MKLFNLEQKQSACKLFWEALCRDRNFWKTQSSNLLIKNWINYFIFDWHHDQSFCFFEEHSSFIFNAKETTKKISPDKTFKRIYHQIFFNYSRLIALKHSCLHTKTTSKLWRKSSIRGLFTTPSFLRFKFFKLESWRWVTTL